ncbi:MAG: hypothetical protein M0R80_03035 [Proteobacteria bacterium]|jgi:hypothetical protein|nr:hypothetical protein [Pseudomonadota bacterium]
MITFKEWQEGTIKGLPELGFTGGPPAFHDIEDRVEQLENKVDLLMKIVRPETMRIAS